MGDREEIRVEITPDGEISIEVRGVKGEECVELTRPLEEALGGDIVSRRKTSEYYESPDEDERQSRDRRQQELDRDG